jgi:hypothetical protein
LIELESELKTIVPKVSFCGIDMLELIVTVECVLQNTNQKKVMLPPQITSSFSPTSLVRPGVIMKLSIELLAG